MAFIDLAKQYADQSATQGPQKDPNLFDYTPQDRTINAQSEGGNSSSASMPLTSNELLGADLASRLADLAQTRYIARNPGAWQENDSSWLIGHHPSQDKVGLMEVGNALVDAAANHFLPENAAKGFLGMRLGNVGNDVVNNKRIGIKGNM